MRKLIITLSLLLLTGAAQAGSAQTLLNSFETSADLSHVKGTNAKLSTSPTVGVTQGHQALTVNLLATSWPNVEFIPSTPWDFSTAGAIAVDVTNPGTSPVSLLIDVWDAESTKANPRSRCSSPGVIAPGQTATLYMPLVTPPDPMTYGMQALPSYPSSYINVHNFGTTEIDLTQVAGIEIFATSETVVTPIVIDNLRTLPPFDPASLNGLIDKYGQSSLTNWTEKVHQDIDLTANLSTESTWLASHPAPAERDAYGGWQSGPSVAKTGFFHTIKYNGKWWLVTPSGHLFFSTGIDGIAPQKPTFVDQRSSMFQWLPAASDPLSAYYSAETAYSGPEKSGTAYDFNQANIQRKYGANWAESWREHQAQRLASWGFNTLGNWSDPGLCKLDKTPYVASVGVSGTFNTVSCGSDAWGPMPDPFDSRFATAAANCMRNTLTQYKGDPWCIGFFIDNELSWCSPTSQYGLAYGALSQNASSSPAKAAFVAQLEAKYASITTLNKAWGASYASWAVFSSPCKAPSTSTSAMTADMSAFLLSYARTYYQKVAAALHAFDPSHLYLGSRFGMSRWTPEVLQAASENCDVMSFNIYANTVDPTAWSNLAQYPKPVLIGEYSFGATDRGMYSAGQVDAGTQAGRAVDLQKYFASVLGNPQFVGLHWFDYQDDAVSGGTFNGENGNYGFVDVSDTPYPALVNAAVAIHQNMYSVRAAS